MESRSSVDVAAIGPWTAWTLAAATSAQFALFLSGELGEVTWIAWGIGLLICAWGARIASHPQGEAWLVRSQIAMMVFPLVLLVGGIAGGSIPLATFGGALLGVFAVGWGVAIPVTQWIAGTAPPRPDGRLPSPPLPSVTFAIALFFALPASRLGATVAGLVAVAALILNASLGAITARARESGSISASTDLLARWTAAVAALAALATFVGLGASALHRPASIFSHPLDAPPIQGNFPSGPPPKWGPDGPPSIAHPGTTGGTGEPTSPGHKGPGRNPSQPSPDHDSSPSKPKDWKEYLALAAVAAVAFAALWLAKRHGDRILAWLAKIAQKLGGPIVGWLGRLSLRRDEARLMALASSLPDPFAPAKDPPSRVARLESVLAAHGVARRSEEPLGLHFRRAAKVLGGDSARWQRATHLANRIRFSPSMPEETATSDLRELETDLDARLNALPDAEARRRAVRLELARQLP